MNLQTIFILCAAFFLCLIAVMRTYARRRWVTVIVLVLPTLIFSIRWARFRSAWSELFTGGGLAIACIVIWWFLYGRKLDPPKEDTIRVWTEEDPF